MPVKRFRHATVQDALRAAREELGPDALVTGTGLVAAPGWRGWLGSREVEVTARASDDTSARRPSDSLDRRSPDTDSREAVVARLAAGGVDREFARSVAAALEPDERRGASLPSLRRAIARELHALIAADDGYARIEVFVGPPGVGKTTTIAKIAAQARARQGRILAMVAADAFRAGAIEQLRVYADIIGAPFRIARTARELDAALSAGHETLLVDTAGRSPSDAGVSDSLRMLGRRRGVRMHLVMAADTSAATARRLFDAYQDVGPDRLVITKLDEAETLSPLIAVLDERQIPISYFTAGQRVPEDLDRATPTLLAAAVLRDRQWPTTARMS
jgi:flagellar biosynthesis protein FlhF